MTHMVFYGTLIAFACGIGVQTVAPMSMAIGLWGLLVGFVLAVVWRRKSGAFSAPYLLLASVCLVAFSLGLWRTEIASWQFGISPLAAAVGQEITINGVITAEPDHRERTVQLYVKTDTDTVLVSTDRHHRVAYGDAVIVTGRLEAPERFTTDLGREFDYASYLKARGVEYKISFATVEVAGSGQGNPIIATLLSAKQAFITQLQQLIPEPAVGLGTGLLLGVKSALGEDIEDDFRRTGIIHIVVLSGYNVMLVVAFILFCFSFLFSLRWRLIAAVIAIIAFALIVGLSATVVRASVMASLVLLAQFLGRKYDVLRALLFAGAVMLLINPYLLLYDIGFQLSFMATLGLILFLPRFESTVMKAKGFFDWRGFLLATIATQIAVLPLLMYHIGEVSLIALVVNVLVLPMVAPAMFLTFATGVVGLLGVPIASLLGYIAQFSLQYILQVAHWFAALPYAAVTVPQFSALGVFGMYGILAAGWWFWQRRKGQDEDPLAGWVIEEELEDIPDETTTKQLPVFFR